MAKFEAGEFEAVFKGTVPVDWYDLWLNHNDLFLTYHIGYWARQIEWDVDDPSKGHLIWMFEEDERLGDRYLEELDSDDEFELHQEAIQAWDKGRAIPPHYAVINQPVVTQAYIHLAKRKGDPDFYTTGDSGDADDYDWAFQTALFGKQVYA